MFNGYPLLPNWVTFGTLLIAISTSCKHFLSDLYILGIMDSLSIGSLSLSFYTVVSLQKFVLLTPSKQDLLHDSSK